MAVALMGIVVLVLLVGVPLVGGMAMVDCPNCHLSSSAMVGLCLAVLLAFLLLVPTAFTRVILGRDVPYPLLLRTPLERPPRSA